jgi:hypothetical protein
LSKISVPPETSPEHEKEIDGNATFPREYEDDDHVTVSGENHDDDDYDDDSLTLKIEDEDEESIQALLNFGCLLSPCGKLQLQEGYYFSS